MLFFKIFIKMYFRKSLICVYKYTLYSFGSIVIIVIIIFCILTQFSMLEILFFPSGAE